MSYAEAAVRIGAPRGTLRWWVHRRAIPHVRLGPRSVVFDVATIDEWLAARAVHPTRGR